MVAVTARIVRHLPGEAAIIEMATTRPWSGTHGPRVWRGEVVDRDLPREMEGDLIFGEGGTRLFVPSVDRVLPISDIKKRSEIAWRDDSVPEIPAWPARA